MPYPLGILMLRYALARNILGSTHEVALTQSEFVQAQQSYLHLELTVAGEEKFDAIARDFLDFESDMIKSALEVSLVGFGAGIELMAARRLFNCRLSNLLSAIRAYTDYMRHATKVLFDEDERSRVVLNRFSHHYDTSFGYRVLEALRNYSQHCGFPIHSVKYSTSVLRDKVGAPMKNTIAPLLDINTLKSPGQFKSTVLRELEAKGNSINLKSPIREYVACIADVHDLFRGHVTPVAYAANESLERLIKAFVGTPEDESLRVGLYAVALDGQVWSKKIPLSSGLWEYGEFLSRSNFHFVHAGVSFVSGEPEEDS